MRFFIQSRPTFSQFLVSKRLVTMPLLDWLDIVGGKVNKILHAVQMWIRITRIRIAVLNWESEFGVPWFSKTKNSLCFLLLLRNHLEFTKSWGNLPNTWFKSSFCGFLFQYLSWKSKFDFLLSRQIRNRSFLLVRLVPVLVCTILVYH